MTPNSFQAQFTGDDRELVPGALRVYREWEVTRHGELKPIAHSGYTWGEGWNRAHCAIRGPLTFDSYDEIQEYIDRLAREGLRSSALIAEAELMKAFLEHVPDAECSCGFYAYYHPRLIHGQRHPSSDKVFGVAEVAGRVLMGTKGVRAERARVIAVVGPTGRRAELIKKRYGIEVFPTRKELLKKYPPTSVKELGVNVHPAKSRFAERMPPAATLWSLVAIAGLVYVASLMTLDWTGHFMAGVYSVWIGTRAGKLAAALQCRMKPLVARVRSTNRRK